MTNDFTANFRKAISHMIATHGEAFNAEIDTWGDSRGEPVYKAPQHMQECSVKTMTGFEERYSWSISDTIHHNEEYGVKGVITCNCGQVENITFIVGGVSLGTILGWLLAEDG